MRLTDELGRWLRMLGAVLAIVVGLVAVSPVEAAVASAPARVERVRYSADGTSTRIIVMLSRRVPYEVRVLPGDAARASKARLVLDFSNARLGPSARAPIGVESGLVQSIRTGQFTARTARVVLDLADITAHRVSELDDPPRLVIDIAGRAGDTPPRLEPPAAVAAASPAPSPHGRAGDEEAVRGRRGTDGQHRDATERAKPEETHERLAAAPRATASPDAIAGAGERVVTAPAIPEPAARDPAPPRSVLGARKRIVIDPGHGGNDPGASGVDGVLEKDVTLKIAKRLKRRLEDGLEVQVLLTRTKDMTRSLGERTAFANANGADLFISIHTNADDAGVLHGIETYTLNNSNDRATIRLAQMENGPAFHMPHGNLSLILSDMVQSGKEEESNALAERLQRRIVSRLRARYPDVRSLGVKKGPFYVLVGAYMPCVLVETSFLSHPVEGRRLASDEYQTELVEGLYLGVADFLADARLAQTL